MKRMIDTLARTLGRCPRCMRRSFAAAALAWLVTAGLAVGHGPSSLVMAMAIAAAAATALWLAHVLAFAARASLPDATRAPRDGSGTPSSRRDFALAFARAALFAALATAISARAAFACTQLPKSCSSNDDCECSKCCGDLAGVNVCQPSC